MKKFRILSVLLLAGILFSVACTKNGTNGPTSNSEIKGKITCKNGDGTTFTAVNPIIHVAYNTSTATTNYNQTCIGNPDGSYSIKGLGIGDYFVTAEYTDPHGLHFTTPGVKVHLGNDTDAITADMTLE
jgi:hypothetical protein